MRKERMEERPAVEEISRLYPAVHRCLRMSGQPVGEGDVTARMASVLRRLVAHGPLTVGELAGQLRLSMAATTELVDRVEDRGLVVRARDRRDRRRVFVSVTDAGHAAALTALPREEDPLARAVRAMTPGERQGLVDGLRALLRAARADG
ncbi:MarR family transcriptional regulator [Microbispora sp. H10885]|uniref:MarR family transcriptional regulator n=1 Tax=Microbispora sp. H10885 TaxID=2729110 RepID=UPI00160475CF|nr:MarR family transcriptional regulator [Microbispora sp. H10885]